MRLILSLLILLSLQIHANEKKTPTNRKPAGISESIRLVNYKRNVESALSIFSIYIKNLDDKSSYHKFCFHWGEVIGLLKASSFDSKQELYHQRMATIMHVASSDEVCGYGQDLAYLRKVLSPDTLNEIQEYLKSEIAKLEERIKIEVNSP